MVEVEEQRPGLLVSTHDQRSHGLLEKLFSCHTLFHAGLFSAVPLLLDDAQPHHREQQPTQPPNGADQERIVEPLAGRGG